MVTLRIGIRAHDVHIRVAWVPVRGDRIPDPNEVLQLVYACQSVEEDLV